MGEMSVALKVIVESVKLEGPEGPPPDSVDDVKGRLERLCDREVSFGLSTQSLEQLEPVRAAWSARTDAAKTLQREVNAIAEHRLRCCAWEDALGKINDRQPAVSEALDQQSAGRAALDELQKRDFGELRAMSRPPAGCLEVCCAVGCLWQNWNIPRDWRDCQVMMRDLGRMLDELRKLHPDQVQPQALQLCVQLSERDDFSFEVMKKKSRACAGMVQFVLGFLAWCKSCSLPEMQEVRKIQDSLDKCLLERPYIPSSGALELLPETAQQFVKAAAAMPATLQSLKSRERVASIASLPADLVLELCPVSGDVFEGVAAPGDTVRQAKEKQEGLVKTPAILQVWTCDGRLMKDDDMICDFCGEQGDRRLMISQVVSLEKMWKSLKNIGENDCNASEFHQAAKALPFAAHLGKLGRPLGGFLEKLPPAALLWRGSTLSELVLDLIQVLESGNKLTAHQASHFSELFGPSRVLDLKLSVVDLLEELVQAGHDNAMGPLTSQGLLSACLQVQCRAMEAMSRIGDGQVIPRALAGLKTNPSQALRCLSMLTPGEAEMELRPDLMTAQHFSQSDAASLLSFLKKHRNPDTWRQAFELALKVLDEDNQGLKEILAARTGDGFSPATKAAKSIVQPGDEVVLSALKARMDKGHAPGLLGIIELLVYLAPDDPQLISGPLCGCLRDRDKDMRKVALNLASTLPVSVVQADAELNAALSEVAAGDWPELRQAARDILARAEL